MPYSRTIPRTSALVVLSALALAAFTQQAKIPIRAVSTPLAATTEPLRAVGEGAAREMADGRLLVNSALDRVLLLYDKSLEKATILADTNGTGMLYTFAPRIVTFLGDSTMLFDVQSRSLLLIAPNGTLGRTMAPPTRTFNGFGPGGGIDSKGRLVYAQLGGPGPGPGAPSAACGANAVQAGVGSAAGDSGIIVRADFETRMVDTIARNRGAIPGTPIIVRDADCNITAVKWPITPMLPSVDTWAMTSTGVLAIIRGGDYHMDWVFADGRKVSSPKMPFDWRRLTDDDKTARIDSARKVVDSVSALGGYRANVCGQTMRGLLLMPLPAGAGAPGAPGAAGDGGRGGAARAGGVGGGAGGDPNAPPPECKWIPMTPAFPALSEMPDYVPPIRQIVPKADIDGNVWILPTTSLAAKDGLLYDVVNPKGELVERVQLPRDRDIIAFGKSGVLYLSRRDAANRVFIERVRIVR